MQHFAVILLFISFFAQRIWKVGALSPSAQTAFFRQTGYRPNREPVGAWRWYCIWGSFRESAMSGMCPTQKPQIK